MTHCFNVEVAKVYGIEKAVILENFIFWVEKNAANNVNVHGGRAYTYNSAEAFAVLFPYFTPRKIAELLRQMEKDGLIESGQFHGLDRKKSYTVTDRARAFYTSIYSVNNAEKTADNIQDCEPCIDENDDVPLSEKGIIENTDIQLCSITDINNTDINNKYKREKGKRFSPPSLAEVSAYCAERKNNVDAQHFIDYYTARDWHFNNGGKMKDWRATVRTWENKNFNNNQQAQAQGRAGCFDENKKTF